MAMKRKQSQESYVKVLDKTEKDCIRKRTRGGNKKQDTSREEKADCNRNSRLHKHPGRKKMTMGVCPSCGKRKPMTIHHIKKWVIWHDDRDENRFEICEKCHNQGTQCLEALIRERENDLLRNHPELYQKALKDYLAGARPRARRRK